MERLKRGKGRKIMAIADRSGLSFLLHADIATLHEVKLVPVTIKGRFLGQFPGRIICDKVYDSNLLDKEFEQFGIQMITLYQATEKVENLRLTDIWSIPRALKCGPFFHLASKLRTLGDEMGTSNL